VTAIGPGTPLVCVKSEQSNPIWQPPANRLTVGAIYFCEKVFGADNNYGCGLNGCTSQHGYTLRGINSWRIHPHTGVQCQLLYCSCCFKPLNDGDTSLVEHEEEVVEAEAARIPIRPQQVKEIV
jgi:hypothetical protein